MHYFLNLLKLKNIYITDNSVAQIYKHKNDTLKHVFTAHTG